MHLTNLAHYARLPFMVGSINGFSHLDLLSTILSTFFITLFPNIFSINSWSSSSNIFGGRLRGVGFRFFL